MDAEGIDVTEAESVFSLDKLGISKSKVDAIENVGAASDSESEISGDEAGSEDGLGDSDAEYEELLEAQMEKAYDQYLVRRGDDVKTKKAVKRTKVAKRALAGEALVQDSEMFDGDTKEYHKMINPEEVCVMFECCVCLRICMFPPIRVVCSGLFGTLCSVVKLGGY